MTDNPSDSLGRQIKCTTTLPSPSSCMPSSWNTFTCLERTLSPFSARLSVCLFRSWVACADVHCEAGASPGGKTQSQEIKMEACVPPGLQSFDMKNLGGAPLQEYFLFRQQHRSPLLFSFQGAALKRRGKERKTENSYLTIHLWRLALRSRYIF